jgi:hypothetical protein
MRVNALGLREQLAFMRLWWPEFASRIRGRELVIDGELLPLMGCDSYHVLITMAGGEPPETRVLEPKLHPRDAGGRIPHMYDQERLCLFLPGTGEWSPEKPIALTIVPWTSVWLFFYEVWLATGEWLGGGVEPEPRKPIRREEQCHE